MKTTPLFTLILIKVRKKYLLLFLLTSLFIMHIMLEMYTS